MAVSPIEGLPWRGRSIAAAALTTAALLTASLFSWVTNMAYRDPQPVLPLGEIVAPARLNALDIDGRIAQARGRYDTSLPRRARSVLAGTPLAAQPFLYTAMADIPNERANGTAQAARLLDEAVRRDPRGRTARFLLMRHALAEQDLSAALAQLAVLSRLEPRQTAALLATVGKQIETTAQIDEVLASLRNQPDMLSAVVTGFVSVPHSAALTVHLGQGLRRRPIVDDDVMSRLSTALIAAGEFGAARELWRAENPGEGSKWVNDPSFEGPTVPPPFGWAKTESNVGVAEVEAPGVLVVDYYGRRPGSLLRQLITLPTGQYTAAAQIEGIRTGAGFIELRISCADTGAELADRPLEVAQGRRAKITLRFGVPSSGCRGQYLELTGSTTQGRGGQTLRVFSLDVLGRQ